jgi:FkbM family methyltransferase
MIANPSELGTAFNNLPLVIYGAGGAGRTALSHLKAQGVSVVAFIDERGDLIGKYEDVPCLTLSRWIASHNSCDYQVLLGVFNPQVDVVPIIDKLKRAGFARIFTMVDYINLCPDDPTDRLWLCPSSFYHGKENRISAGRALFKDDSLRWFDGSMHLRTIGDFRKLPIYCNSDQYMPNNLPRWQGPLRLIDCGAYTGDTIQNFINNNYNIDCLAAFEPDPANYKILANKFSELNAIFIPCGVSEQLEQSGFEPGSGPSCKIDEQQTHKIQCVSIDEILPAFAPNLIKMDIEGSELSALRGAKNTLLKYRPNLAISIYHTPDHLWEIPLWLASLNLGYQMEIRGHGPSGFDLVLYCHVEDHVASLT